MALLRANKDSNQGQRKCLIVRGAARDVRGEEIPTRRLLSPRLEAALVRTSTAKGSVPRLRSPTRRVGISIIQRETRWSPLAQPSAWPSWSFLAQSTARLATTLRSEFVKTWLSTELVDNSIA
jgi:hypothetical protein